MVSVFVVLVVSQPVFVPDDVNVEFEELHNENVALRDTLLIADELQVSPPIKNETSATLSAELAHPEMVGRITEQVSKTSSDIPQLIDKESRRELSFYTNFADYSNYNQYER